MNSKNHPPTTPSQCGVMVCNPSERVSVEAALFMYYIATQERLSDDYNLLMFSEIILSGMSIALYSE